MLFLQMTAVFGGAEWEVGNNLLVFAKALGWGARNGHRQPAVGRTSRTFRCAATASNYPSLPSPLSQTHLCH